MDFIIGSAPSRTLNFISIGYLRTDPVQVKAGSTLHLKQFDFIKHSIVIESWRSILFYCSLVWIQLQLYGWISNFAEQVQVEMFLFSSLHSFCLAELSQVQQGTWLYNAAILFPLFSAKYTTLTGSYFQMNGAQGGNVGWTTTFFCSTQEYSLSGANRSILILRPLKWWDTSL